MSKEELLLEAIFNQFIMCGIFAYLGHKNNAGEIILEGLKTLEYRGYDSWGIALKEKGKPIYLEKHTGKIGASFSPKLTSNSGIGHTRWATHGNVTEENTHPHTDCSKKIIIVHNGIVENFEDLKNKLLHQGHTFESSTDSEIIAHLLEEEVKKEKNIKKAVFKVFKKINGLNAVIVFYPEKDLFVCIKNGSPLVYGCYKNEHFMASDSLALSSHVKNIYFLEDYDLLSADRNGYEIYDQNFKLKKIKLQKLDIDIQSIKLGKYPNYMMKEINEQTTILLNIAKEQEQNIKHAAALIKKAYGTYFIGCGTAYYAALSGTYLFSKIAKRHVNSAVGSEFNYLVDFLKEKSLVIAFSQSGETIDIISSIKKAKEKNAKVMAITNVLGSTLYRIADYKLLLNAGPEKCVLATKSFTAKIAYLYLLAHTLKGNYDTGAKQIENAVNEIKKLLKNKDKIKELAQKLKDKKHIYILGRGASYPTALESALKIKEVSYIHAEGFAAGELKHGVIALIEKGTPVIIYNPEDETYADTLSATYEVKARGAFVIGVSSIKNDVFDEFIEVKNCSDATIIPNVVIAQLLGYYLALSKGFDVDKPRNLAKSVTVK